MLLFVAVLWLAGGASTLLASVFGDGDPGNGTEDSRQPLLMTPASADFPRGVPLGAGTVVCDGTLRGSATLVRPGPPAADGHFYLATAAHVMVDLDSGHPFDECRFHYLGLNHLPGEQVPIELESVIQGAFDAGADRRSGNFGREDWALVRLPVTASGQRWAEGLPIARFEDIQARAASGAVRFHLLAWDRRTKTMALSTDCQVHQSGSDDLGGGQWAAHLLDDCDSGQGASGGGLIASIDGRAYLVGIRSGAHWSPARWPPERYPDGPPEGAAWDPSTNTNFSRAVDSDLLLRLEELQKSAPRTRE